MESSFFSAISYSLSMHFLTRFFSVTRRILFCWTVSQEILLSVSVLGLSSASSPAKVRRC